MKCLQCGFECAPCSTFCERCAAPLSSGVESLPPTAVMNKPVYELASGSVFVRRYQVIEEIGRGGMGRVYKVFDTEVKEKLALKLLNPDIASDAGTVERFRSELRLARTVSHRHVCRMHDLGRDDETGTYFITMEYVPGEDLKSLIHSLGVLPIGKTVAIARQAVEGLVEAHRQGIVHRDLKPQNIMIDREGGARIMDFGIARSVKAKGITGAGVIIGTPEYMSPEQVEGKEADARSDIYTMGVVLFEMLTGRLPFSGETALEVAVKQKTEAPPDPRLLNAQIPDDLARLVLKCLEKVKEKRFGGADDLLRELLRIEKILPATLTPLRLSRPPTSKEFTVRLPSKKIWIPAAVLLLALAAFLVWQFVPESESAKRLVAVLGFRNQSGDPSLDYLRETIPNLLITSLEQSKFIRVSSWQRLKDLLRQNGRDEQSVFDEEACFAACRQAGIEAVVVGFFSKAGETFVSDVKVLDVETRDVLKSVSARGEGVNSILRSQIDEISRVVSRGFGRPALKVEMPLPRIADITTSSIEAYAYFLRGRDEVKNIQAVDAKKSLEKAIALDPTFAIAYLYLAEAEYQLIDWRARDEALKKAKEFSKKCTEKERLYIEAQYASTIENDREKRRRILEELTEKYPLEKYALYELGSMHYTESRYGEAVETLEKAVALDPRFGPAYNMLGYAHAKSGEFEKAEAAFSKYVAVNPGDPNPLDSLAELYFFMGRLDKAESTYREALALVSDYRSACRSLAYIAALKEDYDGMRHWLNEFLARSSPSEKMEALWWVSFFDILTGQMEKSLAGFLSLRKIGESYGQEYIAANVDNISAYIYSELGRFDEARKASAAYREYQERAYPDRKNSRAAASAFRLGLVALKQGRLKEARDRVGEIESLLPALRDGGDTAFDVSRYQLLKAEVSLLDGSPEESFAAAEQLRWADFPGMGTENLSHYNIPMIKDVLARAYWRAGKLDAAVAEYRKLMTIDPSTGIRFLIHPLYHYRLGRILEEKGDRTGAAGEFKKFLEYWKDADRIFPEPADARKRLAALDPASR